MKLKHNSIACINTENLDYFALHNDVHSDVGMGPMPWTINSEIYPLWARSTGNAAATTVNWVSNLVIAMTFLTLTEAITTYGRGSISRMLAQNIVNTGI